MRPSFRRAGNVPAKRCMGRGRNWLQSLREREGGGVQQGDGLAVQCSRLLGHSAGIAAGDVRLLHCCYLVTLVASAPWHASPRLASTTV